MKKLIFSCLAIAMLSSATAFANGGKVGKGHHTGACSKGCPKTGECGKTVKCPVPGCVCS